MARSDCSKWGQWPKKEVTTKKGTQLPTRYSQCLAIDLKMQKIIIKSMQRASTAAKRSNAWKWKIANTTKTSWATSEAKRFAIRTTWPLTPLYNNEITIQKLYDSNTNTQIQIHKQKITNQLLPECPPTGLDRFWPGPAIWTYINHCPQFWNLLYK